MITKELDREQLFGRRPPGHSIASHAGAYLRDRLAIKGGPAAVGFTGRECPICHGRGLVDDDGSPTSMEICRRCIGTGRE